MSNRVHQILSFLIAMFASGLAQGKELSALELQRAIDAAATGSVVKIPAGAFTWGEGIVIKGKSITLEGAGQGRSVISNISGHVLITLVDSSSRITGVTLSGDHALHISTQKKSPPYRVDHCVFDAGAKKGAVLLEVDGNGPGLIDQCTFIAGSGSEMIHNLGLGASNPSGWQDDVVPGSVDALYVEDCTFSKNPLNDQYFWGTSAIQSYYGARTVLRHCTLNYCQIDQHGNPGMIGARWWEFYENTFFVPPNGNQSNYMALRGGSGVVFNNHTSGGPNTGAGAIELFAEAPGNPALYQIGRGINQSYSPAYLWGNDPSIKIVSGSANVIAGRDFIVSPLQPAKLRRYQLRADTESTIYNYAPLSYPHPLRNSK